MKRNIKNFAITYEQGVIEMAEQVYDAGIADKIRLMPDTHIGKAAAIGFTAPLTDKVVPNIVGVDIGCGMAVWSLGYKLPKSIEEIDKVIHKLIPAGFDKKGVYDKHTRETSVMRLDDFYDEFIGVLDGGLLSSFKRLNKGDWFLRQLGSLGSGNHFIEIGKDDNGMYYLTIHSGSRGIGVKVNEYWQNIAVQEAFERKKELELERIRKEEIEKGTEPFIIENIIEKRTKVHSNISVKNLLTQQEREQAYLTGENKDKYLSDMRVAQTYAIRNRMEMAKLILNDIFEDGYDHDKMFLFDSTHNFISDDNIIRKGATSAHKDELAIIPINMRDGSLIVKGKGNEDWNFSAPHGAGRLMSRTKAREVITLEEFTETMRDIHSTTVVEETIDEAPMAYKDMEEIMKAIEPTAEIVTIVKPIYNFKGF